MPPKPTKTPILAHAAQQKNASHVQQRYPPPKNPNAVGNNIEQKKEPLLQSASQPNLNDPNREIISSDMPEYLKKCANNEIDINNPDNLPVYYRSKSCFRWVVLFLSCWAMFGSYYCYDNPTALANQFQDKYNLTDTQYNLLYSVYSFPNIILPLFGGALIDKIGAEISLLIFLCFITAGQALFAFAASINSYPLMLIGRVVYGFGGESLCVAESALLAIYFMGTEVAFAMGLNLSLGRAGSSLNDFATLRIYNMNNSIAEALWAGVLLLSICLLLTILLVVLDKLKAKQKAKQGFYVPIAHSGEVVQLSDIKDFDILYWLLTVSCIVVYGCVLPWNNIGSAFMQAQYGFSKEKGNNYLMFPYLISAFCVPVFGFFVDRVGRRSELLMISTAALTITHAIFAWFTEIEPMIALALMGVAYSIYASAIWPAISLVVKESKLGTAYGFITAVQNGGLALFPIIVGSLTQSKNNPKKEYYYVEIFFFGLGLFGVFVGILLWFLDSKGEAKLAKPSIQKEENNNKKSIDNKRVKLLDDENRNAISLQTPDLMYEQHEKENLEHTPVVMENAEKIYNQ